jgi:hypothetical protein
VLAAAAARLRRAPVGARVLLGGAVALATVLGIAWYRSGPDASGWAARAGTPRRLLVAPVRSVARVAARRSTTKPTAVPTRPFHARFTGRLTTRIERTRGLVLLDIRGRTRGGVDGLLWIRLQGIPAGDGGVTMTASGAAFGTAAAPNAYTGSVSELQGADVALVLRNASGRRLALRVRMSVDQATGRVAGVVDGGRG